MEINIQNWCDFLLNILETYVALLHVEQVSASPQGYPLSHFGSGSRDVHLLALTALIP